MSDSCCQKEIDVRALQTKQRRTLVIVLAINAATFVLMLAAALHAALEPAKTSASSAGPSASVDLLAAE